MTLCVQHISSFEEFIKNASQWDALWVRSQHTCALARSEHLQLWMECFATDSQFHALIVTSESKWIAALPVILKKKVGMVTTAALLGDGWTVSPRSHLGHFRKYF